jgi:hypothetical protein
MRENGGGGKSNPRCIVSIYENVTMKSPVELIYANKNVFKKNIKHNQYFPHGKLSALFSYLNIN